MADPLVEQARPGSTPDSVAPALGPALAQGIPAPQGGGTRVLQPPPMLQPIPDTPIPAPQQSGYDQGDLLDYLGVGSTDTGQRTPKGAPRMGDPIGDFINRQSA